MPTDDPRHNLKPEKSYLVPVDVFGLLLLAMFTAGVVFGVVLMRIVDLFR